LRSQPEIDKELKALIIRLTLGSGKHKRQYVPLAELSPPFQTAVSRSSAACPKTKDLRRGVVCHRVRFQEREQGSTSFQCSLKKHSVKPFSFGLEAD